MIPEDQVYSDFLNMVTHESDLVTSAYGCDRSSFVLCPLIPLHSVQQ